MEPFTVIIPLIPQHDQLLKKILLDLSAEEDLIHEIIVSRSESFLPRFILEAKFNNWAKKLDMRTKIRVSSVRTKAADGSNRARAWEMASTTYVAFMDADDRYAKNRLSIILKIFTDTNCDGVIHNYFEDDSSFDHTESRDSLAFITQLSPPRTSGEEFGTITDVMGRSLPLHYAHLSVKNKLRESINYSDRFPGADIEFCQKILTSGRLLYYTPVKLSKWSRNRSFRYKLRLIRNRLFAS